jgi:hypothetical protein
MICLASAIRHRMLRQLTSLNLSNCSLSTELLQVLSGAVLDEPLQRLKFLSLAKNQIKKKGMRNVAVLLQRRCLPSLEKAELSENPFGDEGLQELTAPDLERVLEQVKTLSLVHCHIENEGGYLIYDNIRLGFWREIKELNLGSQFA